MNKTKILIVDDVKENIYALTGLIEADDLEILSAQSADEALDLLVNHDVALALLDVHMPNISGFELARLIRGVKKFQNLPIIFITAHQREQSIILEGYETGAVDFLFKPIDPYVVRSKVRVFVQLDQQAKQLQLHVQELNRLRNQAESANLAKSQFLANMSHEIRTPLTAVLGFTEILANPKYSAADRMGCVEAIQRNGQLLLRLIDDILDFSKIEARRLEFEKTEFSLNELLRDVEAAVSLKAQEKGIYLRFHHNSRDGNFKFLSDPMRIKQALLNIVGNAVKFTSDGGVDVTIRHVSIPRSSQYNLISFEVKDTGIGITAEQASRLFQPFSQADASTKRKFGGTGLGLMIAKQIAIELGGDLILKEPVPGSGSTFVMTLSLETTTQVNRKDRPGRSLSNFKGNNEKLSEFLSEKTVLIIDDSQDNRVLMDLYLEPLGLKILKASSGLQALEMLQKDSLDLILMDIQMPEMDGYETTKKVRQSGFNNPIIAVTAHAMKEEHEKCIRAGCNFVLTKPLERNELIGSIIKFLQETHKEETLSFKDESLVN